MNKKVNIICLSILIVAAIHVGAIVYCMGLSFTMGWRTAMATENKGDDGADAAYLSLVPKVVTDQTAVDLRDNRTGKEKMAWPLMVIVPVEENSIVGNSAITILLSFSSFAGAVLALIGLVRFVVCLNRREVFSWKSVKYLRHSSYGMLLCGIASTVMGLQQSDAALLYIDPADYSIDFSEQLETGIIIFGLFILLMAEAFAIGLKMKEEQELTI